MAGGRGSAEVHAGGGEQRKKKGEAEAFGQGPGERGEDAEGNAARGDRERVTDEVQGVVAGGGGGVRRGAGGRGLGWHDLYGSRGVDARGGVSARGMRRVKGRRPAVRIVPRLLEFRHAEHWERETLKVEHRAPLNGTNSWEGCMTGLMKRSVVLLAGTLALTSAVARADFSYEDTTQITGGSIVGMMKMVGVFSKQARQANEPIVSTVSIQGNRMPRADKLRTEIIDLDAGTITVIDHTKKQYTTMTFEQMRQQMDAAMAKAKAQQAKSAAQQPQASAGDPAERGREVQRQSAEHGSHEGRGGTDCEGIDPDDDDGCEGQAVGADGIACDYE